MAPVLQYLDGLLVAIGHGLFDPDRTRSGRWVGCRSLDDALRKVSDMARAAGGDACVDGSDAFEGVWEPGDDWGLPESRVLVLSVPARSLSATVEIPKVAKHWATSLLRVLCRTRRNLTTPSAWRSLLESVWPMPLTARTLLRWALSSDMLSVASCIE